MSSSDLDLSPSLHQLSASMSAHYGVTVGAFVRSHRVFQAVSLLHRGDELADVSTACGFADQSHMTRLIRAQRGLPPGKLKKRFAAPP